MIACENGNVDAIKVLLKYRADLDIANADGDTCLHVVARRDYCKDVIHTMIKNGADVNAKNMFNETPLMKAHKKGNIDATKELLNAGADHKMLDGFGDAWIHRAIDGGYRQELIQTMIDHGADVNAINKHNETAFMKACKTGNVDAIKLLLSVGANPNIKNDDGQTCIHHTVIGNWSREVLRVVIAHGGDMNAATKDNITALMLASRTGNVDAINVLLATGADPNITDVDGYTCFHDAVDAGCNKETLTAIMNHGTNIHAANKKGVTPLMAAVWKGNVDAIKVLLNAGADLKDCDTCLHRAIRSRCSKEILQRVISHGADVNAKNEHGVAALRLTCQTGNEDAIIELLRAGADPNIVDEAGETCLHTAIRGKCSRKHLEALITHGADVNATNENNETALRLAYQMEDEHAINELLKAGADSNIVNEEGETCLHTAIRSKCSRKHLEALITHGADVNATNENSETAIQLAYQMEDEHAIYKLLKAGADVNIVNEAGETCLHTAIRSNCLYYLQALITHGADVNATNKSNETALELAFQMKRNGAIGVLLGAGAHCNIEDINEMTGNAFSSCLLNSPLCKAYCLIRCVCYHCRAWCRRKRNRYSEGE